MCPVCGTFTQSRTTDIEYFKLRYASNDLETFEFAVTTSHEYKHRYEFR